MNPAGNIITSLSRNNVHGGRSGLPASSVALLLWAPRTKTDGTTVGCWLGTKVGGGGGVVLVSRCQQRPYIIEMIHSYILPM